MINFLKTSTAARVVFFLANTANANGFEFDVPAIEYQNQDRLMIVLYEDELPVSR